MAYLNMQPSYKVPFFVFLLGVAALISIVKILPTYIVYNDTISEPVGWYWLSEPSDIKVGKTYTINVPLLKLARRLGLRRHTQSLLKKVVARSGDVIQITAAGVLVNHKLMPNSSAMQSFNGIQLNPLPNGFTYKLKNDEYFMLGQTPHSFDSRYFGIIKRSDIKNEAKLIIKEEH